MARTEFSNIALANKGLSDVKELFQNNYRSYYQLFTEEVRTDVQSYRVLGEADFASFTPISQGTPLEIASFSTPLERSFTTYKYGRLHEWDGDVVATDVYDRVPKQGKKLMRAGMRTWELVYAQYINLATNAATATLDGLSLANAAHTLATGTYSNSASGAGSVLSDASLQTGIASIMKQPSWEGDPSGMRGPFILVVPPELEGTARKLEMSKLVIGSNNNDINWAGGRIARVVVSPFFTSATAWALIAADADENPLKRLVKRPIRMQSGTDDRTDSSYITCVFSIGLMPIDWRGFYYSAGA